MKLVTTLATLILIVGTAASLAQSGGQPEIYVRQDANADFSGFKTYGVVEPGAPLSDAAPARGRGRSQPDDARRLAAGEEAIRQTIKDALTERGFKPDQEGSPDFFIGYDALAIRFDDPMNMPGDLIRPTWGNTVSVVRTYSVFDSAAAFEGRLTIFVVDGRSKQIIWSATAEGNIRNLRNIENNAHRLVSDMMSKMP
ncbi:MAG: DUF4136 domain-containing protein [Gammaproteobacteria bacterium]|nr:MAG: DUF4136 domain-containing protein [Gammaproteobacteria bacterium]